MPKGGHRVIRATRLEAYEFARFLAAYEHDAELSLSLLCPPGSNAHDSLLSRRQKLQMETGILLVQRLSRGFGRANPQLGDGGKAINLELPIAMIEYVAGFAPRRSIFGKRRIEPIPKANLAALVFVQRCVLALNARRGRPSISVGDIDRHKHEVKDRQFYRLVDRKRRFDDWMVSSPVSLLGGKPTE